MKGKKAYRPKRKLFWENEVFLGTEKSCSEALFVQAAPEVIRWATKVVPYLSGRLNWAEKNHNPVTLSVRQTHLMPQKTAKRECEGLVRNVQT